MSIKYSLKKPFQFGAEYISELNISEPKSKHLRKLPVDTKSWTFEHIIDLVVSISNEPTSKIDMLSIQDLNGIMEVVGPFLEDSQEIGN